MSEFGSKLELEKILKSPQTLEVGVLFGFATGFWAIID